MFGFWLCILIEVHCIGLQVCGVSKTIERDGALGVYHHMVRVVVVTLKEPHPARTGVGTTTHLLLVHSLTIDIEVSVTIGIGVYCL